MAGGLITVVVEGKGALKTYINRAEQLLPRGATVAMLVASLPVPEGHRILCMRDGKRITPNDKLHDGDSVIVVSMLAGG